MLKAQLGKLAEREATRYLESQGLRMVVSNFSCKFGEVDLIMAAHTQTLVFVEVRSRRERVYGSALDTVTIGKQGKVRRTAELFLQSHPQYQHFNCRFDVVGIQTDSKYPERITWIRNAFY
jgi:putative endonuclease